jgi:hypothetical protein
MMCDSNILATIVIKIIKIRGVPKGGRVGRNAPLLRKILFFFARKVEKKKFSC